MFEFCYLEKDEFEKYANGLFSVLYDNMSHIVPTGNRCEEDFKFWFQAKKEELQSEKRYIIIIFQKQSHEIVGYFQYSIHESVFMMEDIQINELYQGKYNIFRRLYGFVFEHMESEVDFVEANANKKNTKSLGILSKLGLSVIGENKTGKSYHFRGTYAVLLDWYNGKGR